MQNAIDMNSDVGESYGAFSFGADAEIMSCLSSANVACGFHAGDPVHMERTVKLAKDHGVSVGVHWGLPDVTGFGRRRMAISPEEARCLTVYQIGALRAVAEGQGAVLDHLVPHGALYSMLAEDESIAGAMVDAILMTDPTLVLYWPTPLQDHCFYRIAAENGIPIAQEICVDMEYRADGGLVLGRTVAAHDPAEVADRVQRFVEDGKLASVDGADLEFEAHALLLHGDGPNAGPLAQAIRDRLSALGVALKPAAQLVARV